MGRESPLIIFCILHHTHDNWVISLALYNWEMQDVFHCCLECVYARFTSMISRPFCAIMINWMSYSRPYIYSSYVFWLLCLWGNSTALGSEKLRVISVYTASLFLGTSATPFFSSVIRVSQKWDGPQFLPSILWFSLWPIHVCGSLVTKRLALPPAEEHDLAHPDSYDTLFIGSQCSL